MPPSPSPSSPTLNFLSLSPQNPTTLLLLHGGFGTHAEFLPLSLSPHLSSYHLLLPDLPSHGSRSSSQIRPFTLPTCVSHLSSLIHDHAHDSRAHIIGFSLGGYVALSLAATHPELVDRVFVTGCGRGWNVGDMGAWMLSGAFWLEGQFPGWVKGVFNWWEGIEVPEEVRVEGRKAERSREWGFKREVVEALRGFGDGMEGEGEEEGGKGKGKMMVVRAPTCVVAGDRHDPVEGTARMGRMLRRYCGESRAVVLEGLPHAWGAVEPELFALGVQAWIEGRELPARFKEI